MRRDVIVTLLALLLLPVAAHAQVGGPGTVVIGGGGSGGTGDVTGPSSSTDNAFVRFDSTTGKIIQTSNLTCSDVSGVTTTIATITPAATTGASVAGQSIAITASPAVASTDTNGAAAGGSVTITAGAAARRVSGDANGGNINLVTGAGIGTGTLGKILIPDNSSIMEDEGVTGFTWSVDHINVVQNSGVGFSFQNADSFRIGRYVGIKWVGGSSASADTPWVGLDGSTSGVLKVTDGSTGVGSLLNSQLVEANTAVLASPNVITSVESGTVFTNEGVGASNYHTLPSAATGLTYTFVVESGNGMRIVANTGDTITLGTRTTAAAGFIDTAVDGSFITLVAVNATKWIATSIGGVWGDGVFTYDDRTALYAP